MCNSCTRYKFILSTKRRLERLSSLFKRSSYSSSLRPPERDGDVGIRVEVRPRRSTAPPQHTFDEKLDSLAGLAELIERASDFMGHGPSSHAVHGNGVSAPVARFSRDILYIEVCQKGYQPLTLVDLPRIIQSGKKQQNESESDKKMVNSIAND